MKVVTCETLKNIDQLAEEKFALPGLVLMEVAGYESYLFIKNYFKKWEATPQIIFFIGSGHNGGDGLVVARHLFNKFHQSIHLTIITDTQKKNINDNLKPNLNQKQLEIIHHLGIPVIDYRKLNRSKPLNKLIQHKKNILIIDAILGIGGVSSPARGSGAEMISLAEKAKENQLIHIISLDIPSGIHYPLSNPKDFPVISADITLTYGLLKDIFYYPQVRPQVGDIHLLHPGFPPTLLDSAIPRFNLVEHDQISNWITPFQKSDYKKSRGRIVVVAGKRGMLGAAYLTTEAAWKSGAGLVTLFTTPKDRTLLTRALPHTMVHPYSDFWKNHSLKDNFDLMIFGPGLGRENNALQEILETALRQRIPLVIDADGIYYYKRILEDWKNVLMKKRKGPINAPVILTPHLGEMRQLLSGIQSPDPGIDPWGAVEVFFKYYDLHQTIIVIKSYLNYIISSDHPFDKPSYIVEGRNPLLGVGGSGDVLAGITAVLTARQLIGLQEIEKKPIKKISQALFKGSISGCFIHQEAGKQARDQFKIFTSKELISKIPEVLSPFLKF